MQTKKAPVESSDERKQLLLGAGKSRDKRIQFNESPLAKFEDLTTIDIQQPCDLIHDLNDVKLPFDDDYFDEIHAYEILEHVGTQGDWRFFFEEFNEFWRILKPNGFFCATTPMWDSPWAWGDPGHTRIINKEMLTFLCQDNYSEVGKTPMTDYRQVYHGNFEIMGVEEGEHQFGFVLKAIK